MSSVKMRIILAVIAVYFEDKIINYLLYRRYLLIIK